MDDPKAKKVRAGRIFRVENTKRPEFTRALYQYHAVWVEDSDGKNERCIMLTDRELRIAERRAERNPEDVPKKPFLTDLFD